MSTHTKDSFTLGATGDSIITRPITPYEGGSPQFDERVSLLRGTEATVTNFEMITPPQTDSPSDLSNISAHLGGPPEVIDDLAKLGIDLFSAASNISAHYGTDGMRSTIAEFESRNIPFAGLGKTLVEAREPAYLETQAGRVALVSACSSVVPGSVAGEQTAVHPGRPGINPLRTEKVYQLPPHNSQNYGTSVKYWESRTSSKKSWIATYPMSHTDMIGIRRNSSTSGI